jgi:class 3 adenylate cyclase
MLSRALAMRYAARYVRFATGLAVAGFAFGIAYRYLFDPVDQRELAYYARSGLHGIGLALAGWFAYFVFSSNPRSPLGAALRRSPLAVELVVKATAMTGVLIATAILLQFVLYGALPDAHWRTDSLPLIVAIAFGLSVLAGLMIEAGRLIGGRTLVSFLLGTYHRPIREHRIVMFLDIAGSTALAEQMGELRVHDLITRFFFDIDKPIAEHQGAVHAYVGDEVIVTWPLTDDRERNAQCLRCFFAVEERMAELATIYQEEFGIIPHFRAGVHTGPVIVSECGSTKRQLAYFGDTMNVAARLCEYCKMQGEALVVSAELVSGARIPGDLAIESLGSVMLRGRIAPIESVAVRRRTSAEEGAERPLAPAVAE